MYGTVASSREGEVGVLQVPCQGRVLSFVQERRGRCTPGSNLKIRSPENAPETDTNLPQDVITDSMSNGIIDCFKVIEIEEQEGTGALAAVWHPHRLLQPIDEEDAIG